MNNLDWCKNALQNENNQKQLEKKVTESIEKYFKDGDEYAMEKFIKSYCEPIIYFENLNLHERKINPGKLERTIISTSIEDIHERFNEVETLVSNEIEDSDNNFSIEDIDILFGNNREELKEKISSLMELHKDKVNFPFIKFLLKRYYKGVRYLETLLLLQRDIDTNKIRLGISFEKTPKGMKDLKDIEKSVSSEIKRQYRHFITFLSDIK